MSQLTTHILDVSKGRPAAGVSVTLYQQQAGEWKQIALGTTNEDGRIPELLRPEIQLENGIYRLSFHTKEYFERLATQTLYPHIEISFHITGPEHYHIPLLLSPFGYSTYRGS